MMELCKMNFSFLLSFSFLFLNCISDVYVTTGIILQNTLSFTVIKFSDKCMRAIVTSCYWAHICSELKVSFEFVSDGLLT